MKNVFSKGWTKELKGNSSGIAAFVPEWKGKYMIEVSRGVPESGTLVFCPPG